MILQLLCDPILGFYIFVIQYAWSPAEGLDDAGIRNPIANPEKTTRYRLRATTVDGCEMFADVLVAVKSDIKMPTVFSPNDDGVNDVWNISELSTYPKSRVTVFNRYGELVFRSSSNHTWWDGTYKGRRMPVGVYYYVILLNYEDMEPITGNISIIR